MVSEDKKKMNLENAGQKESMQNEIVNREAEKKSNGQKEAVQNESVQTKAALQPVKWKAWKHFCTITRHRHKVMYHCFMAGIFWQGIKHDLSKYSPTEFIPGARYYQGYRSPNDREREEIGYSAAWMHHKGRNRHHFEYWNDYNTVTRRVEPVRMPVRYVKEMFCDRVAASKIYQGDAYTDASSLAYFRKGIGSRPGKEKLIHPETALLLEKMLVMLAEEGEKKTFAYIRKMPDVYETES